MHPAFIFLITTLVYIAYLVWDSMRRPRNYPPGPPLAPWVGNAVQLRKETIARGGQHKAFDAWAKQYNTPVLGLKLAGINYVVALSYEAVRDVHLQEVFEGRPDNFFLRLRTMGKRMGIVCTDGKLWYEHRHFTMKQMRQLGFGRSQMGLHIQRETESLIKYIDELHGKAINPALFLSQSVINILWSMVAGKRFERDDQTIIKLLDLLKRRSKLFDFAGGILAQFPWLRFVAPEWSGYNLIKQVNKEMYAFIMDTINEHKSTMTKQNEDSDYTYAYLREMQNEISMTNENTTFNESQLIMTILDFFIAGSHTTSTTMDLVLLNLALRKDLQQKVYEEILLNHKDNEFAQVGSKQFYPYLEAFIMEVQRCYCNLPLSGPRRALWDTKLAGYDIPKDTTILIGLGAVLMNREHWRDPETFRPERFIDSEGKVIKDEYFIPFGYGRRRCPGDALARACLFSFLVSICGHFEILPSEREDEKPSLNLQPGIVLSPKPYKIRFMPRKTVNGFN